jgi:hypothetical protein
VGSTSAETYQPAPAQQQYQPQTGSTPVQTYQSAPVQPQYQPRAVPAQPYQPAPIQPQTAQYQPQTAPATQPAQTQPQYQPQAAAPATQPAQTQPQYQPQAAEPATQSAPVQPQTSAPVKPAAQPFPLPPAEILPGIPLAGTGKVYRIQVGSYKVPRNAVDAFEKLKNAGLNPAYERNGDMYRIVLPGIRPEDMQSMAGVLGTAGFRQVLLREDTR